MSEDLRSLNTYPAFYNFTANDSTTTEILLPSPATQITLGAVGKEIFVCAMEQQTEDRYHRIR